MHERMEKTQNAKRYRGGGMNDTWRRKEEAKRGGGTVYLGLENGRRWSARRRSRRSPTVFD